MAVLDEGLSFLEPEAFLLWADLSCKCERVELVLRSLGLFNFEI